MSEPVSGVVVALDDAPFDDLIGAIEVMVQQGLKAFALHACTVDLATWVGIFGARARIGVHRVASAEQARDAVAAGVTFVFADLADADLFGACGDVPCYVPAMTPTEIRVALKAPAAGVQVFPADVLGPNYSDSVASLGLAERCVPRGGLGAYAAERWFAAGAPAVVVDSQILGDSLTGGDLGSLRDRCDAFVGIQPERGQ